jgi:hypothetical protein
MKTESLVDRLIEIQKKAAPLAQAEEDERPAPQTPRPAISSGQSSKRSSSPGARSRNTEAEQVCAKATMDDTGLPDGMETATRRVCTRQDRPLDAAGTLVRRERSEAPSWAYSQRVSRRSSFQPRVFDQAQKSGMAEVGSAAKGTSAFLAVYAYASRTRPSELALSLGRGEREHSLKRGIINVRCPPPPLLQVDGLIMPGLVELCAPHLVHALVIGAIERHGRPEPNVEIAEIFESAYQFLGVELGATTL